MTDAELKEFYIRKLGGRESWQDPSWAKDCLREMRGAMEAPTFKDAEAILRDGGWGNPEAGAQTLRGAMPCPRCDGDGFVSERRKS